MIVILDTGPLGLVLNPNKKNLEAVKCQEWMSQLIRNRVSICVPEIAYYETRRKLLHLKKKEALERLENFVNHQLIDYAPITTEIIEKASELWAWARLTGQQTAHDESIDSDVILAATAIVIALRRKHVVIATTNVSHLARYYTKALEWRNITS